MFYPTSLRKPPHWLAFALFALGIAFIWQARPEVHPPKVPSSNVSLIGQPDIGSVLTPIAEIRVGQRVVARNPSGELDTSLGTTVTPATWRKLTLLAPKADGSQVRVELLRPLEWLDAQGVESGAQIDFHVPECGLEGEATVLDVSPCPEIATGTGPIVIGTFHHQSAAIYDVYLDGQASPIGTTANHPFWSESRHSFIAASDLEPGEALLGASGLCAVSFIVPRYEQHAVFNIEVQGEHCYRVSPDRVLVHNLYEATKGKLYQIGNPYVTRTAPSGMTVTELDGVGVRWEYKVGSKGQRGPGYHSVNVQPGMQRGHVRSVNEGAQINAIDDGPLNIIDQTSTVNLSNVKRFENWRIKHAMGERVIVDRCHNGFIRTRIPGKGIDVTYNPLSTTRFAENWYLVGGVHQ